MFKDFRQSLDEINTYNNSCTIYKYSSVTKNNISLTVITAQKTLSNLIGILRIMRKSSFNFDDKILKYF